MAGKQGAVAPVMGGNSFLPSGRLKIDMADQIFDLNIDKTPLLKLLDKIGKQPATQMKFEWMTDERRPDWIQSSAVGGSWASGAATSGTFTVSTDYAYLFAKGDVVLLPAISAEPIYVTGTVQGTGVISGRTVTGATINLNGLGSNLPLVFLMGNSHEDGGGMGTIKSAPPVENFNYIQIFQRPIGITTTTQHIAFRGEDQLARDRRIAGIEHAFDIEKTFFFGKQKYLAAGYENGNYTQNFTGGIREALSTNVVDAGGALTETEFAQWVKKSIYHSQEPVIFCGELVFEAIAVWAKEKVVLQQNEKTYGIKVVPYVTPYGDQVTLIPHRELLKQEFAGEAYMLDMKDIKYRFLQGLDTHMEVDIQQKDLKQKIDEYRTWAGLWLGNEKRHGLLYGVTSISAS